MSKKYGVGVYNSGLYSAATNAAGEATLDIVLDLQPYGSVGFGNTATIDYAVDVQAHGSSSFGAAWAVNFNVGLVLTGAVSVHFGSSYTTDATFDMSAEGRIAMNYTEELNFDVAVRLVAVGNVNYGGEYSLLVSVDGVFEPEESKFWGPQLPSGVWVPQSDNPGIWVVQPKSNPWG